MPSSQYQVTLRSSYQQELLSQNLGSSKTQKENFSSDQSEKILMASLEAAARGVL